MNERIGKLAVEAGALWDHGDWNMPSCVYFGEKDLEKFAELIVAECMDIAKDWEDELENSGLLEESNAVGIVKYRIARQFGVKE
jgi:hypothetical protein